MSNEYDPRLQELFAQAEQEFDREAFARDVLAHIDRERRRTLVVWIILGIAGAVCLIFLAEPLISAVLLASSLLPVELVEVEARWVELLLSPVNSIAAALAIGALALARFYRWIFR